MRAALADLEAYRKAMEDTLRRVLHDPRDTDPAEWIADLALDMIRLNLAGKQIPPTAWFIREAEKARAAELIHLGASVAAERLGCNRATVYRRAAKHRDAA